MTSKKNTIQPLQTAPSSLSIIEVGDTFIEENYQNLLSLGKAIVHICVNSPRAFEGLLKLFGLLKDDNRSVVSVYEQEVFTALTTISPECANILISKIDGSLSMKSDLFSSIRKGDYKLFQSVVRESECDLTSIERPCNILYHCINFANYVQSSEIFKDNSEYDESEFYDFLDKARDTVEAIFNHTESSVIKASKATNKIASTVECEDDCMMDAAVQSWNKTFPLIIEVIPYLYAAALPYLSFSERHQIEQQIHRIIPSVHLEPIEDVEIIYSNIGDILVRYTSGRLGADEQSSFIDDSIELIQSLNVDDDCEEVTYFDESVVEPIPAMRDAEEKSNDNASDDTSNTKASKRRIRYKVDSLSNKGAASRGNNFQWSDSLKKWYEEHTGKFEDFVRYVAKDKGYIPNEQKQVNAFIRTITGRDVPNCDEKVRLLNNGRDDATRAMLYLKKCKIICSGDYCDIFTYFDVDRPERYREKPEDNSWMSGYARDADKDFKITVIETFNDFSGLKVPKEDQNLNIAPQKE